MNSRRFTVRCLPCCRKDNTPQLRQELLRCGISSRSMSLLGHSRRFGRAPGMSVRVRRADIFEVDLQA